MMLRRTFSMLALFLFLLTINVAGCSPGDFNAGGDDLKVIQEKTYKINAGNNFKLETSSGDVLITTWDKSEVHIKVLGNEKAEERMTFSFSGNEKEVDVKGKRDGNVLNWFSSGISLRYEVKVPKEFNTNIHTSGGDIRIADINGTNRIRTSGGDINVKRVQGDLNAGTSGGDVTFENSSGKIEVSTSGGDISGVDFKGDVDASTSGGDIKLKGSDSKISAETSGGNIVLIYTGDNKGIMLSSSGGDITADVPSGLNADARFTTSGGSIDCNLSTNNATKISSSKFEAELNQGGNPFIAKTSGGDISIRKK